MKTLAKILLIASIATSTIQARDNKPYAVKSIKIEFDIKGKDSIGKKRVLIYDYGNRELVETNIVKKINGKVNKQHGIRYLHKNIVYGVDFDNKIIHRNSSYMGATFGANKFKDTIDESLKAMHLKKIGTDTVAGVKCDIWKLGTSVETCYYKGLPLRTNMRGVVESASKIEIDASLSLEDFKLPDFPVNGRKFTQNELEAMDSKDINKQNKDEAEVEEGMKLLKEAYKKAGVVKGKRPTKEQMQIAREYMQKAMFPIQKKKFLEETKDMKNIKECLEKANSVKDANHCDPDGNSDRYEKWNSKIKKETLKEISMFETKILPCVEKSKNAKEMQMCFPKGF